MRFGHLMPTLETALRGVDLAPSERGEVEAEIWRLQSQAAISVAMAPGYFSAAPFFPCAPLTLEELNLDYQGNLTLCCQVSGHSGTNADTDVMGNLHEISLAEAVARFLQWVATYLADKQAQVERGAFGGLDHYPCWYYLKYLDKVPWLERFPQHPWAQEQHRTAIGKYHSTSRPTPSGICFWPVPSSSSCASGAPWHCSTPIQRPRPGRSGVRKCGLPAVQRHGPPRPPPGRRPLL